MNAAHASRSTLRSKHSWLWVRKGSYRYHDTKIHTYDEGGERTINSYDFMLRTRYQAMYLRSRLAISSAWGRGSVWLMWMRNFPGGRLYRTEHGANLIKESRNA